MQLIDAALEIAVRAHRGQVDKAGQPYILHPLRLMAKMTSTEAMCAALLHDVLEDSETSADDLRDAGLPNRVIEAVQCLTKQDGEDYDAFIERVLGNALAAQVKRVDIEDNIDVLRLSSLGESDLQRVAKYHRAWKRLESMR